MFYANKLSQFSNIKHCFFSRKNGVSKGIYQSLNCGLGSGDKKENVKKNLELISKKMNIKKENLVLMHQTHSNKVIVINKEKNIIIYIIELKLKDFFFFIIKIKIIIYKGIQ